MPKYVESVAERVIQLVPGDVKAFPLLLKMMVSLSNVRTLFLGVLLGVYLSLRRRAPAMADGIVQTQSVNVT